ncbi:ParB/RepB/Spo0J family partition protein [Gelria sp. Kuro-4]|uniref:ParB/RepB/Spo0J family partition protein n=1 Tax=Gelria sp. Kuro-4 TaxID=2796927 RepID=UPI001BEFF723|nr:ParB/RepB/Spo0J family partition protein [Gelria sp. Kuro-4]MDI3522577.1 ParB family transcriptional regulator, chromosome partitioning protein [Bacillota bacterium]BCV23786.1 stage 0 sporulation protein J [Gelria sp. Kuro-4]
MTQKKDVRHGLGRGLAALLPAVEAQGDEPVREVPVKEIRPNSFQPRRVFDEEKLAELAESVRAHGVLQPVVVRAVIGGFELVAGERRWRAAQLAGLERVPVVVRELSDAEMMEIALIENLQREDLNPLEEATAYQRLLQEFGLTQEELARRLGKSRSHIANIIRLLNLPAGVQEYVSRGTISMGHARALLALEDAELQNQVCRQVVTKNLSVRETENLIRSLLTRKKQQKKKKPAALDPWMVEVETNLKHALATQVRIKPGRRGGRIEIEYYSTEDLERLTGLLAREAGL